MPTLDALIIGAILCIWILLLINVILLCAGYRYYTKIEKEKPRITSRYPTVSILVPAHNEGKVIGRTVNSLLAFNYPPEKYEIIVINDNSTDNSAEVLEEIKRKNPDRRLTIVNNRTRGGGKGKSNALNIGLEHCSDSEYLMVYDADNTPEKNALLYLASEIDADPQLGAVIGKFRTRNKETNILTRFINIETLFFQWMSQAGRWQLFKLCTIPGTNYIVRTSIIREIGGWDVRAIAEDTEISYRIYMMGYLIKFYPKAVTWEQEPQTLKVWFKQRTRWVKGNVYVIFKNLPLLFSKKAKKVRFDILYSIGIYFLLLASLIISDTVLIFNLFDWAHSSIAEFSNLLWLMAFSLFVLSTFISLITEKGEMRLSNVFIIIFMYVTYCKMWMAVAFYGIVVFLIDVVFKRGNKWYKTERF
jgi:cellulose synthase/poly-beta-1,6-N-acetylglucosamine synthase-like glycosyltransferase